MKRYNVYVISQSRGTDSKWYNCPRECNKQITVTVNAMSFEVLQ